MPHATDDLKAEAYRLGFETAGVCRAEPAAHIDFYRSWLDHGFHGTMDYLARHTDLKADPRQLLPEARSVIAVTLNYSRPNTARPRHPHIATYALGRDYHGVIRGKLKRLSGWIERGYPGSTSRACVDSAPILEREYANRAGLGWFGKNTCLIDSHTGSWFFIGLLLTSVDFDPDAPAVGGCGTCRECIDACPTGAIVQADGRWQVDSRSCISYLTIEHRGEIAPKLAAKMGDWTFGCDVCQDVCQFNRQRSSQPSRARHTTEQDLHKPREWPDLQQLAQIDEAAWDELSIGSPIRRAGIVGIRRNAKINVANLER